MRMLSIIDSKFVLNGLLRNYIPFSIQSLYIELALFTCAGESLDSSSNETLMKASSRFLIWETGVCAASFMVELLFSKVVAEANEQVRAVRNATLGLYDGVSRPYCGEVDLDER